MAQPNGNIPPFFNPDWQTRLDGPLADPMRARITTLLASSSKTSLASIARAVDLSPTFIAGLMRDKAIRTRHMDRVNANIERLEQKAGLRPSVNNVSTSNTKLLDLMSEVAGMLPPDDRAELMRRLSL